MKTYEREIDELIKHMEQIVLLTAGGFGSGDAAGIGRMKAVLHLRGLRVKATSLMLDIAEEDEKGVSDG